VSIFLIIFLNFSEIDCTYRIVNQLVSRKNDINRNKILRLSHRTHHNHDFDWNNVQRCVQGDTIRAMDATNAVLGANSTIALISSMNDPSVTLVAFNHRDIFVKVKLM